MNNPERMKTLRTLADTAERECARILAVRRRAMSDEEQRLAQLQAYLKDYAAPETGAGLLVDSIRTRRDFVSRLHAGIEQQQRVLASLRVQLDHDLERWREAHSKSLALTRYTERLQAQVDEKLARREQGKLDEVGRRQHMARSA